MKILSAAVVAMALALTACGERVEIPPATVGKILTKNGYQPDTIPPSKTRLEWCWAFCPKLYVAQANEVGLDESFRLFMPKDQLNMAFDLRGTFSIRREDRYIDQVFNNITPDMPGNSQYHGGISFRAVYAVYGQPVLREITRSAMAEYSINDVASNRDAVNAKLQSAIEEALSNTPIRVIRVGLADVQFPDVITKAKEVAAERRVAIEQEEAKKQIRMVELQTELETARMRRNIEKEKAQAALEQNEIIAKSVTPEWLAYRRLEVLETMAKSDRAVFVPMEALGTLGLENRIMNGPEVTGR